MIISVAVFCLFEFAYTIFKLSSYCMCEIGNVHYTQKVLPVFWRYILQSKTSKSLGTLIAVCSCCVVMLSDMLLRVVHSNDLFRVGMARSYIPSINIQMYCDNIPSKVGGKFYVS